MKNESLLKKTLREKEKESQMIFTEWAQEAGLKYEFQDAVNIEAAIKTIQKSDNKLLINLMTE